MENNRFELQENDFEVIEAPCAKCVYNCKTLFGCEKYERIPATIRIGEEQCDYRLDKVDIIGKHLNAIKKRLNEDEILISYPMLTLINENVYYLYLIMLTDGTVFGKVAIDETDKVFKLKEFTEKKKIEAFDKKKYVSTFTDGVDLYAALLENQKANFYNEILPTDGMDTRMLILKLISADMDDIICILKKINPDFFELLV